MHFHLKLASTSAISFSLLIVLRFHAIQAAITIPNNETIPAAIVFGDSIVDPGNNNYLQTTVQCNFPPYGRDFKGGISTGRFGNGKVPSDLLAEELGIKELLPAYLDPTLQIQDLLTGVSFASGGSGFDPLTAEIVSVLSLTDQLELFKEYIGKLKVAIGEDRTTNILSKSIFIVCTGSDDIANTYFTTPLRRDYDVPAYTDLMVRSASSFLQEIYNLGARRIGVFSAPPIGCVPSQRTLGGGEQRECAQTYNQAAKLFNFKLSSELNSLNDKLPHARLVYIDIYTPLLALIQNPAASGFEVVDRGCCGTGKIEVVILCNDLNPYTCTDVSKYLFWDSYHPAERTYKILLPQILRKYVNNFFCGKSPC
ncbi:hypothetical protein HHK36_031184 [Tetracentron sinense]|uniref:GDSL esterase/lipase EXL3 n=1 Tax=Tetracentron sinense TaxID=13715 RepID=A0A834YE86_TETSI|nr:hypothetical protein HHK36_031184 [Tetracentron sinense]